MKIYIKQVGNITSIQNSFKVDRGNKPELIKKNFTFTSLDGQICYPEIRNQKIAMLDIIKEGDMVTVELYLQGSEKNGKKYNNVICNSIKLS